MGGTVMQVRNTSVTHQNTKLHGRVICTSMGMWWESGICSGMWLIKEKNHLPSTIMLGEHSAPEVLGPQVRLGSGLRVPKQLLPCQEIMAVPIILPPLR